MEPQQAPHPGRPDYTLPQFEGLVNLIIGNSGLTRDEAIEALNNQWDLQHPDDEQQQQQNHGNGEAERIPEAAGDAADNGKNPFAFDPDLMVSSSLQLRPLDYALKRLEAFKYVPLWYFTREGLAEAATMIRIADEVNEPLVIAREDEGMVTLKPVHAVGPFKNAKPDTTLLFNDLLFAKNVCLRCIEEAKWGNEVVDSYNWFFHRIENHELRQEGACGEKTLVRYAAHTRQDWHDKMAQKHGFNIATINENLVAKFARQLDSQDVQAGLSKVIPNLPRC